MLVGQGALEATDEVVDTRGAARRRRREGAAGQGGRAGRAPVRNGLDRPAGHEAELGNDDGLRHAARGRLELPVRGVPAQGRRGTRRADRHRRADDRHPLPDGRPPRRRRRGDATGAAAAARAEDGPLVAGADRARGRRLVAGARRAGAGRGRPRQSAARLLRSSRRGSPTTASSRPTRARRRTGSRATCASGAG